MAAAEGNEAGWMFRRDGDQLRKKNRTDSREEKDELTQEVGPSLKGRFTSFVVPAISDPKPHQNINMAFGKTVLFICSHVCSLNIALTHHFSSPSNPEWVSAYNYTQIAVFFQRTWLSPLCPFISLYFRCVQLNWDHITLFETHYSNLAVACTILPPRKSTDKIRTRLGAVEEKILRTLR